MALLPNFTPFVSGTKNNPAAVNTPFQNLHNLLGTASSAPTFSDANVATGAAINPAKISGTAMVLASAGTQTVTKATNFSVESLTSSVGVTPTTYTGGTLFTSVTSTVAAPDMISYAMPANTLTTTLRGVRIYAWGTNLTTSQTPAISFGGTSFPGKPTAVGADVWILDALVFRTGLNTQLWVMTAYINGGSPATTAGTVAITETGSITIKALNTAGTNGNITQKGMVIFSL